MDVLIGANNFVRIRKSVHKEICHLLKSNHYETGGIIGMKNNEVTDFQIDSSETKFFYEYYPNSNFLETVINKVWKKNKIRFAGMVHSHLHNSVISQQDILYCRMIIEANASIEALLIGVVELSNKNDFIRWYLVTARSVLECKTILV